MDKKQILALDSKKHVKIWLLHKLGMSRREIAEALGTNPGHVGNEIKAYEKNEDKRKAAEGIFGGTSNKPSKEQLKKIIDAAEDQMTKAVKAGDTKAVKKGNEFIGKLIDQYNETPDVKKKAKGKLPGPKVDEAYERARLIAAGLSDLADQRYPIKKIDTAEADYLRAAKIPKGGAVNATDENLQAWSAESIAKRHAMRPSAIFQWANKHKVNLMKTAYVLGRPESNKALLEDVLQDKYSETKKLLEKAPIQKYPVYRHESSGEKKVVKYFETHQEAQNWINTEARQSDWYFFTVGNPIEVDKKKDSENDADIRVKVSEIDRITGSEEWESTIGGLKSWDLTASEIEDIKSGKKVKVTSPNGRRTITISLLKEEPKKELLELEKLKDEYKKYSSMTNFFSDSGRQIRTREEADKNRKIANEIKAKIEAIENPGKPLSTSDVKTAIEKNNGQMRKLDLDATPIEALKKMLKEAERLEEEALRKYPKMYSDENGGGPANYYHAISGISSAIERKNQMGKGGILVGKKHGDGGIKAKSPNGPLEVEGGEIIINAAAAKEHCEELSKINQSAGGGVAFPCDHPALDGIQGPMNGKGAKLTYGGKIGAKNTGGVKWFKDKEGRDRFEIDDSDAVVNINEIIRFSASSVKQNKTISLLLSDIITVWSGYINYPDLKNVNLVFIPNGDPDGALYTYWPDLDLIFVNSKYITNEITDKNSEREKGVRPGSVHANDTSGAKGVSNNLSGKFAREIRKRLFHEIQHPIQKREGIEITPSDDDAIIYALKQKHGKLQMGDSEFINWIEEYTGDKYKYIKSDFYKTIPSEYEALDVERRAFYTKEQRESIRPEIELKKAGYGTSIGAVAGMMGDGAKIAEGVDVEKEHADLYNEISQRLEADGHKMPMSKDEFFRMIAAAHIKERGDYYPLLKKYVEHAPSLMDKPYYLLTKEEVIACRDFIEMRAAAGMELTVRCQQRLKDLARYSMVKFNTLLKNLK